MAERLMEMTFRTALWRQFGAAIDTLENALLACPASLWRERLWYSKLVIKIQRFIDFYSEFLASEGSKKARRAVEFAFNNTEISNVQKNSAE